MTPLEQARQAGKDEPRGIVGAAGLDPTFLVQRQLFSQEEILRRELGMRPHHRRRQRCHIVSDGENRSNQIPRRFGHDPTDRMRTLNPCVADSRSTNQLTNPEDRSEPNNCGPQVVWAL
jgi:hypothetical protein